jgi:tyrosine-protein kinase Etk/Wzc
MSDNKNNQLPFPDIIQKETNIKEENTLKQVFDNFINNWYLFVTCIFLCIFIAIIYTKFAPIGYKVTSKILVRDDKGKAGGGKGLLADADLSSLLGTTNNAENEIELLKSRTVMANTVKSLHLNIIVSEQGNFRPLEAEENQIPVNIKLINEVDSIETRSFKLIDITAKTFHLIDKKHDVDVIGKFGVPIKFKDYQILLTLKNTYALFINPRGYVVTITSIDAMVERLLASFDAELTSKQSTVIGLTLKYPLSYKGERILQTIMNLYLKDNLDDKVRIADSTLTFIENRLSVVTGDLHGLEKQIETFKKTNQLANIEEQSKALISNESDAYKKRNELDAQLSIINDISKYINSPNTHRIIPSSLTVSDPVFAGAIQSYNMLILERERAGLSYTDQNPIVINLDQQIDNAQQNLIKSFNLYKRNLNLSKAEVVGRNKEILGDISGVPEQERIYLDYSRQQAVKQQLYIYLLEKREETAISKTSTFSTSRIIDDAKSESFPFTPNKSLIYMVGLIAGIALPLAFLSLKDVLNVRLITKADLLAITNIPIVGEIIHNDDTKNLVVNDSSRSIISERFRSLRTNLQYLLKPNGTNVLMFTSSMSGEGKSFISFNLGSALALSGKKVVLLELDLRKPRLSMNIGLNNDYGFTNYIVSNTITVDEIIKPTPFHENVFLISSGPIPPNPAELLLSSKVEVMLNELGKKFDYIIIDTAPVGLVSDALIIEKYVDVTLYIVRQKQTFKSQINILNDLVSTQKLKRAYLVVNDIETKQSGYYGGYGYGGYGYGYGYGGYGEDVKPKTNWLSRFFKK